MKKVILISGKAGHGKDTTANYMKDALERRGNKVVITHYGDLVKYVCKAFFGWNGLKDVNGRSLLQYVGTDIVRAKEENFWVSFVYKMVDFFQNKWDYVLIPDARFPNEVDVFADSKFDTVHVRVVRNQDGESSIESSLTKEQSEHSSETALDDCVPEYLIENTGTIDELKQAAELLVEDII